MPSGTHKAGGRRWGIQESTQSFSPALGHLLGFKGCFSQWFVLLLARTLRASQLFDIYFIACVSVQQYRKTTQGRCLKVASEEVRSLVPASCQPEISLGKSIMQLLSFGFN